MKRKTGTRALTITTALALLFALMFMAACSGTGNSAESGADNGSENGGVLSNEPTEVGSLMVDGMEFILDEFSRTPGLAPAEMAAGNRPFEIVFTYSGDGDAREAFKLLRREGILLVNGEQVDIPTTTSNDNIKRMCMLASTSADLDAAGLSVVLIFENQKLVIV